MRGGIQMMSPREIVEWERQSRPGDRIVYFHGHCCWDDNRASKYPCAYTAWDLYLRGQVNLLQYRTVQGPLNYVMERR